MLLRRKKDEPKPDGTMSLMEHLYELRTRLFWAALGIVLGTAVGFIWYTVAIPSLHIPNLGDILTGPYCKVPASKRLDVPGHACALLATDVFSPLQIRLKAAFMVGAVLSCPVWLYQLWSFVTPALYDKERKFARIFVSFAAILFAGGAVLAYFVISEGLTVLLGFAGSGVVSGLDPSKYFQFLQAMLPDGQIVLFRFYDPRVFRAYLPTLNEAERWQWFAAVEEFRIETKDGSGMLYCYPDGTQKAARLRPA